MSEPALPLTLYPPIEPYRHGMLAVDELHTLYWEECGNPDGMPVLFLHGGPGSGLSPSHRQFFDPAYYRIVLFAQRGAGRSTPYGERTNNTTQLLIEDIETIRNMLGITQWLVFGGSWGSTLALAYGEEHPQCCLGFILRGIFLCTPPEIDWFLNRIQWIYPELHAEFIKPIPEQERGDLLQAYASRLFDGDPAIHMPAARNWSRYEGRRMFLLPQPEVGSERGSDQADLAVARMEAHYMQNEGFLPDDQLIRNIDRIRHLPGIIVQGRYDVICPPHSAYRLHQAWPEAKFQIIPNAGHAAMEPGTTAALVQATEQFKKRRNFD